MSAAVSRAALLRGGFGRRDAPIRPPWVHDAASFTDLCERCGACQAACEAGIVATGRGGFPEIDFRAGACSFCGRCADACRSGALQRTGEAPWSVTARIAAGCLAVQGVVCRLCEERCEQRAIRFRLALGGYALPEIDAEACNGCGACVSACPSQAIHMREETA